MTIKEICYPHKLWSHYTSVSCNAVGLLRWSCPHRRPIMKTPGPCCLIVQVTSYLTWNNSSLKQSHSRTSPLVVFKQWPDQIRQFCSRSFVTRCFVALAFYFGLVVTVVRKWLTQLVSQNTRPTFSLPVWYFPFTTLGRSVPISFWVTTLCSCILV